MLELRALQRVGLFLMAIGLTRKAAEPSKFIL
jgi:hypothetical protein